MNEKTFIETNRKESIYVTCKVGDNGIFRNHMVVDWYDPISEGHDAVEEILKFSPEHRKIFYVVRLDRDKWLTKMLRLTKERGPEVINEHGEFEIDSKSLDYRWADKNQTEETD